MSARVENFLNAAANNSVALAGGVASTATNILLIFILSFYFLISRGEISRFIKDIIPDEYEEDYAFLEKTLNQTFASFLQIQVVLGLLLGLITLITLLILGINFAVSTAIFAGILAMVPVVGAVIFVIPVALAGLTVSVQKMIIAVAVVILAAQLVYNVVAPKLMGAALKIHPIIVLLSFLIGYRIAGVWGAIFAVPVTSSAALVANLQATESAQIAIRESQLEELKLTKVVDNDGHPRLVYHGTMQPGYSNFDSEHLDAEALYGPGFYFTEDPEIASQYGTKEEKLGGAIYPAYLVIKNPLDLDDPISEKTGEALATAMEQSFETHRLFSGKGEPMTIRDYLTKVAPTLHEAGAWNAIKYTSNGISGEKSGNLTKAEIVKLFQKARFDGLTYEGGAILGDKPHKVWIAFNSEQIVPKFTVLT